MSEALKLPLEDRERLMEQLVRSMQLDILSDVECRNAWQAERAQRIAAADRGEFTDGDWRELIDRARQVAKKQEERR